jgi:hypothetical protein
MAVVMVAPKAVGIKVAGQRVVAVAKGMAVDGQVGRATHPAEGAAMHRLAAAKSSNEEDPINSACGFS